MKIILEGADGTGKTTLAKILANKYGLDIAHCTQRDAADYNFQRQTLRKEDIIWDRHVLSELIYPKVFGRAPQIGIEDARLIVHYAKQEDVKIFVLTCDNDTIRDRLYERGGEHPLILKNIGDINHQFVFYAKEFHVPIIDTSRMTLSEIFSLIEEGAANEQNRDQNFKSA